MEEKKPENNEEKKEEDIKKPKSLIEQVEDLKKFKEQTQRENLTKRKMRIPRKAKVRRGKLKKGWIGIIKIDENRNLSGEKQRIDSSAFMSSDGTYHSTNGDELLFFEGKYPVLLQPSWKKNPLKINPEGEKNETYGQKYLKAKMLQDTIKVKPKAGGNIIIWIIIGVLVLVGINYFAGGNLFG